MGYTREFSAREPQRADVETWAGVSVIEFGAPWCGHCIAAQPAIKAALGAREDVRHVKVEDGRGQPLGRSFRIKLWPTLVVLRDGVEVAQTVRPLHAGEIDRALRSAAA